MNKIEPRPAENTPVDGSSQVDAEAIVGQIWDDLGGAASRSEIRMALTEVAPEYENVRVKTYVPIFLRRDVIQRLKDRLPHSQGATAPEPKDRNLKGIS